MKQATRAQRKAAVRKPNHFEVIFRVYDTIAMLGIGDQNIENSWGACVALFSNPQKLELFIRAKQGAKTTIKFSRWLREVDLTRSPDSGWDGDFMIL